MTKSLEDGLDELVKRGVPISRTVLSSEPMAPSLPGQAAREGTRRRGG